MAGRREGEREAWARAEGNPVGGWYGSRTGDGGRSGMYVPPLLEALGMAELTQEVRNDRMRPSDPLARDAR